MGALEEAHLAAVAVYGCDEEEEEEDLLVELGGGEAPGDAMEPAVRALLAGLGEDDLREGLRRTPKRVAKAFRDGTRVPMWWLEALLHTCCTLEMQFNHQYQLLSI